jgi:predicted Zn-dependent peptidase
MTIKTHIFPNGFRLVYEKSKNVLPISSVNIFCDVGSVHESSHLRGASHLIEHMCFKGTRQLKNSKDIFVQYDKIGAYFNAYTSKRYTCYVVKCDSCYIENSIEIISDMLLNSTFIKKEFFKEHNVVIEENIKNQNDPVDSIFMESEKLLYNGSSLMYPIDDLSYHTNKKETILSYEDVIQFYHQYYVPENMLISVVSELSFETIIAIINKTFFVKNKMRIQDELKRVVYDLIPQKNIVYSLKKKKGVENILITIAFRTCSINHPDKYKLIFLKNCISQLMSGRFFLILREKYGLIYSCKIEIDNYDETGGMTIFTQTDSKKILGTHGLIPMFVYLLNDLIKNGITEEELHITKGYMRGNMIIDMENINDISNYNGSEILLAKKDKNTVVPMDKIYDKYYKNISRDDIHQVIRTFFTRERMNVCLLGEHLPDLEKVEKEFRKFSV